MQHARTGRHPLGCAVLDHAATTVRILVLEAPVHDVGDGLETAMRVPVGALRLARGVVDGAHLVHVDEGVELVVRDAGEGARDRETLALVPLRAGHVTGDAALAGRGRGCGEARQRERVCGDGGHVILLAIGCLVQPSLHFNYSAWRGG